jgi:hypothetical protein
MKKSIRKINRRASTGIILVIIFAILGYYLTYLTITLNTIQYSELPKSVKVKMQDHATAAKNDFVTFDLGVKSKMRIDSIQHKRYHYDDPKLVVAESYAICHQNSAFLMWSSLICIMMTIAAASAPVFTACFFSLKKEFGLKAGQLNGILFYTLLLIFFLMKTNRGGSDIGYYTPVDIVNNFKILLNDGDILTNIVNVTIVLTLPCMAVVFLTARCADTLDVNTDSFATLKQSVRQMKSLDGILKNALHFLAIIVVFAVLTSSALGASIESMIEIDHYDLFPKEVSYLYGAYFTLFLCVMYVPVYYHLVQKYESLKTCAADMKEKGIAGNYDALFTTAAFQGSAVDNVKMAITIISPLLTALIPNKIF